MFKHILIPTDGSLDAIRTAAQEAGLECRVQHVYANQPYEAIIKAAEASGCDAICMASHGRRGVSALLIGSETAKVLTHSRIPVLVWR